MQKIIIDIVFLIYNLKSDFSLVFMINKFIKDNEIAIIYDSVIILIWYNLEVGNSIII